MNLVVDYCPIYFKIIKSRESCSRSQQEISNRWKISAVISGKTTTKTPVSHESVVASPKTYYKIPSRSFFVVLSLEGDVYRPAAN